jgi:hypothetical protein
MPDGYIKDKQGLIDGLKQQVEQQGNERESFLASLSPEQAQDFLSLTKEEQDEIMLGGPSEVPSV